MAKRYATVYPNGHRVETSSAHEANNLINYGEGQVFFLSGNPVEASEFYQDAQGKIDAAWEAKEQTHRRVRVRHGSSASSYVTKWVKK